MTGITGVNWRARYGQLEKQDKGRKTLAKKQQKQQAKV